MRMATRTYENSMAAFEEEIVGCIGTPDYIAPEVFNHRQYGFSVDWLVFRVSLILLSTDRSPYPRRPSQTMYNFSGL